MARFRNGILIGQARQFIPGTSAPKELKEPDRRWDKKKKLFLSHYSAVGG